MFLLIWLRPVKYPFKNNRGQAQQRLVSPQCIHNDQSLLACLCLTVSQLLFSHSALIETVYYPTSTSWLFQQVLKMLPCGVVKKLIWLICGDCSSGGEEGPGAICGSAVCLVGCDEWVERMLICAWKASQLLTCWGSTPAGDRETPIPRVLPREVALVMMSGAGGSAIETLTGGDKLTPV